MYIFRGAGLTTTKVFQSGNSQAVRIPREFQFDVAEVEIERHGDEIILRPPARNLSAAFAALTDMPEGFFAEGRQETPRRKRAKACNGAASPARHQFCIYIARNRPPSVAKRFARAAPGSLGISLITWGELCFGADKSNDPLRAHERLARFVADVPVHTPAHLASR